MRMTTNRYRVSFGGDGNVLELDSGDSYIENILKTTERYTLKW